MFEEGCVAIISSNSMDAVTIAAPLRRAGIPVETFLSGNIKKQFQRAANKEALVIVRDDGFHIKDMLTNEQRKVEGDLLEAVQYVLSEGYYDPNESTWDYINRVYP